MCDIRESQEEKKMLRGVGQARRRSHNPAAGLARKGQFLRAACLWRLEMGRETAPQFNSPNSKRALFVVKEGLWLSWLSKGSSTVQESAKSPEAHAVAKAFCYSLSGP